MRQAALVLCALGAALNACSRDARAVRLPTFDTDAEVYRITCEDSIAPCREKAAEVCDGAYDVLESAGAPIAPRRVTSDPGPRTTGPRYQRADWQGSMVIGCRQSLATDGAAAAPAAAPVTEAPSSEPRLRADQVCIPGSTQLCLGPGACRGAQACAMDGKSFGSCDCGDAIGPDAGAASDPSAERESAAPAEKILPLDQPAPM